MSQNLGPQAKRTVVDRVDSDLSFDIDDDVPVYRGSRGGGEVRIERVRTDPIPPAAPLAAPEPESRSAPRARALEPLDTDSDKGRGTTELGLLLLRLAVGGLFVFHGIANLTGWWQGPGIDALADTLADAGFSYAREATLVGVGAQLIAGAFVILGVGTPVAASALLSLSVMSWLLHQSMEPGLQFTAPAGTEYQTLLAAACAAIVLVGPGRLSVDGNWGWVRRPHVGSLLLFVAALGAAVGAWVVLSGANPLI